MSDIDFDELDRAVSGALGSTPTQGNSDTPAPKDEPSITPVERTRMGPPSAQGLRGRDASAPAARRSSGRFMDIVHPSSDMRSTDKPPIARSQVISSPEPQAVQPTPPPVISETPSWSEPLESPFLPDAKVEKRPLGGAAPAEVTAPFDFQGLLDEPEEELLEAPEPQERIEATSMPDPIDFAAAQTSDATPESSVNEPSEEDSEISEATPERSIEEPTRQEAEEPVGPTSITPQYKEQPSSNQTSGAIYDTESYHQPVIKPPKKKPSWLIIVWILLLVLLGAAAGWAVYTFVLPAL